MAFYIHERAMKAARTRYWIPLFQVTVFGGRGDSFATNETSR